MTDILDALLDNAARYVELALVQEQAPTLLPIFHMVAGDQHMIAPGLWDDEAEKLAVLKAARVTMKLTGVTAYSFVGEGWTARHAHDGPIRTPRPQGGRVRRRRRQENLQRPLLGHRARRRRINRQARPRQGADQLRTGPHRGAAQMKKQGGENNAAQTERAP